MCPIVHFLPRQTRVEHLRDSGLPTIQYHGVSEMTEEPEPQLIRDRLEICELDRARMSLVNPTLIEQKKEERTIR